MSQQEDGLRSAVRAAMIILASVILGPWLLMLAAAWLLEPRTGSWGPWPHIIGLSWAALLIAILSYGWFRR